MLPLRWTEDSHFALVRVSHCLLRGSGNETEVRAVLCCMTLFPCRLAYSALLGLDSTFPKLHKNVAKKISHATQHSLSNIIRIEDGNNTDRIMRIQRLSDPKIQERTIAAFRVLAYASLLSRLAPKSAIGGQSLLFYMERNSKSSER